MINEQATKRWRFEKRLVVSLCIAVILILALTGALVFALGGSTLTVITVLFFACYPLIWIARKAWLCWKEPLMGLTTLAQGLGQGENYQISSRLNSDYIDQLNAEITKLASEQVQTKQQYQQVQQLFAQLFDSLPIGLWVFDRENKLLFANPEAQQTLGVACLLGAKAEDLGFQAMDSGFQHASLSFNWQTQTASLTLFEQPIRLLFALDIAEKIQQSEHMVQSNLLRVISHELRNSLTPMSSLADTLLTDEQWNEQQVRKVLERVRARADGLLDFVNRFAAVAKIPEPKIQRCELQTLVEQSKVILAAEDKLSFRGEQYCQADPELFSQILINLVKNAREAVGRDTPVIISVNCWVAEGMQHLTVTDNGQGFVNLDNAMTPLYTTKTDGAGIGLAFVGAVVNKHKGHIKLSNNETSGACIEIIWPL